MTWYVHVAIAYVLWGGGRKFKLVALILKWQCHKNQVRQKLVHIYVYAYTGSVSCRVLSVQPTKPFLVFSGPALSWVAMKEPQPYMPLTVTPRVVTGLCNALAEWNIPMHTVKVLLHWWKNLTYWNCANPKEKSRKTHDNVVYMLTYNGLRIFMPNPSVLYRHRLQLPFSFVLNDSVSRALQSSNRFT